MKLLQMLLLAGLFSVTFGGVAAATPISFQLNSVTIVGGTLPTSQTYLPALPLTGGSGDIDFGLGTGYVTLPNYSLFIDVQNNGNDARIDISGWIQTITSIDGLGNVISTGGGTAACTNLGGLGSFVCGAVSPTIAGWPPVNGASLLSSAVLNQGLQTITVIDNSSAVAGTVTQVYSYSIVPEPGTALLVGLGIAGFGVITRRRIA